MEEELMKALEVSRKDFILKLKEYGCLMLFGSYDGCPIDVSFKGTDFHMGMASKELRDALRSVSRVEFNKY